MFENNACARQSGMVGEPRGAWIVDVRWHLNLASTFNTAITNIEILKNCEFTFKYAEVGMHL